VHTLENELTNVDRRIKHILPLPAAIVFEAKAIKNRRKLEFYFRVLA